MNIPKKHKFIIFTVVLFIFLAPTSHLRAQGDDELYMLKTKIQDKDINAVKELIASGIDINHQYVINGYTPLMIASYRNNVDMVKLFISEGADINKQGKKYGHTALIIACNFNYVKMAKLLISKGANITTRGKDGSTALIAAGANSQEIVELLLSKGADVTAKKADGTGVFTQSILGIFWEKVTLELPRILLSKGVDINEAPISGVAEGYTSLIMATRNNKVELVRFLVDNGANVNAKTKDGDTALSIAVKNEFNNIINILKSTGAK